MIMRITLERHHDRLITYVQGFKSPIRYLYRVCGVMVTCGFWESEKQFDSDIFYYILCYSYSGLILYFSKVVTWVQIPYSAYQ